MKYKAYPEYKESGVEWLGQIPEHWNLSKLRYMFSFGKGLTITKEQLQDEGIPCVSYGEVHSKYGFEINPKIHSLKCVSEEYLNSNADSLLLKGDIVFADTSEDLDGSGNFTQLTCDGPIFAGYHTIIARPLNRDNSRFYAYLLDSKELRTQIKYAVKGVKVYSITQAILRSISIWVPSSLEQSKIASFLDHETAKIDQLIAKQETLIELLKEKRQAVISHAVTKGLNPAVKMKDSGVEWLGEVPEHWGVMQLRRYVKHIEQGKSPECEARLADDNEWAVLKSGCVNGGVFRQNEHKALPFNINPHAEYEVKVGDLLMSRASGSVDLIGSVAFVETCREKLLLSDKVFRIFLSKDMLPEYFSIIMKSDSIRNQIKLAINGAEGLANNITKEAIKSFFTTSPPISEQVDILRFIKQRMSILEKIDAKLIHSLHLLKERRSALISAAVTGKIDVRDWKPKDNA